MLERKTHKRDFLEYLKKHGVSYLLLDSPPSVQPIEKTNGLLRVVFLEDEQGTLMAVLPQHYFLDIGLLCKKLNRDLHPIPSESLEAIFPICELDCYPPIPEYLGVQAIIESSVSSLESVYFLPGDHHCLIGMKIETFMTFHTNSDKIDFGVPLTELSATKSQETQTDLIKNFTPLRIKQRVERTIELPPIPVMATRILKLRFDPKATAKDLAEIIEKDPSLAAQLMNWAGSAYYGYSGSIQSVEAAIVKVLGFDLVMNLALGISLASSMKVPIEGPIGLKEYWRFAIYTAALVEKLVLCLPPIKRPPRGLVYLSGLLHNIGFLLLAQLFPSYYELLERHILANPTTPLLYTEQYVLGVGHDQMGTWLMKAWNLPPQVLAAVQFHHQIEVNSEYFIYPNLVLIAITLLKKHHIGDAFSTEIPPLVLDKIGITAEKAELTLEALMKQREDLASLADELVAFSKEKH